MRLISLSFLATLRLGEKIFSRRGAETRRLDQIIRLLYNYFYSAIAVISLLLTGNPVIAQDSLDIKYQQLEQRIEYLVSNNLASESDLSELEEKLTFYLNHPINLNKAKREELKTLGLLNEIQISNLLAYIAENGNLLSVYELQHMDGYSSDITWLLLPFVMTEDKTGAFSRLSLKEIYKEGDNLFYIRSQQVLEKQKGYAGDVANGGSQYSYYMGNQQKIYTTYRFDYYRKIRFGITGEKDAGEEFFSGSERKGFDFYSAHFYLKDFYGFKSIALGDFSIAFGQGLTAWSGFALGKSGDAVNIQREAPGIIPYTSTDENRFLRGTGITYGIKKFDISAFVSKKKIDGDEFEYDTLSGRTLSVSYLPNTGYHRTYWELKNEDVTDELIYGGNISFNNKNFHTGITALHSEFDTELKRNLSLYNRFEFSGSQLSNFGADYSLLLKNFSFFGEGSVSDNGGYAFLNGCIISLHKNISLSVLYRDYSKNYQTLLNNAFSEGTKSMNEKGIYTGLKLKITSSLSLNAYYDRFLFPWLRYQVNAPSTGSEWWTQLLWNPNKKTEAYFSLRKKDKFTNSGGIEIIDYPVPASQTNYRLNYSYTTPFYITLRNRIEVITYKKENSPGENGIFISQDIIYKHPEKRLSLSSRFALFDTPSYTTRIYVYENDLPYSFSFPYYYNKGMRYYFMIGYDITAKADLFIKYGQICYLNKDVIYPWSPDEIQGSKKSELKLAVRMRF